MKPFSEYTDEEIINAYLKAIAATENLEPFAYELAFRFKAKCEELSKLKPDYTTPDSQGMRLRSPEEITARQLERIGELEKELADAKSQDILTRKMLADNDDMLTRQEAQIEALTKELASDEEIEVWLNKHWRIENRYNETARECVREFVKWMRERLKEGKPQ